MKLEQPEDFIPHMQAMMLHHYGIIKNAKGKETFDPTKGFSMPAFARYRKGKFEYQTLGKPYDYNSHPIVEGDISAPTFEQAFRFLRERGFHQPIHQVMENGKPFGWTCTGSPWDRVETFYDVQLVSLIQLLIAYEKSLLHNER